jgi:hypothetical protein
MLKLSCHVDVKVGHREVAKEFNNSHLERNPMSWSVRVKILKTVKETGSVIDRPHSGHSSIPEEI